MGRSRKPAGRHGPGVCRLGGDSPRGARCGSAGGRQRRRAGPPRLCLGAPRGDRRAALPVEYGRPARAQSCCRAPPRPPLGRPRPARRLGGHPEARRQGGAAATCARGRADARRPRPELQLGGALGAADRVPALGGRLRRAARHSGPRSRRPGGLGGRAARPQGPAAASRGEGGPIGRPRIPLAWLIFRHQVKRQPWSCAVLCGDWLVSTTFTLYCYNAKPGLAPGPPRAIPVHVAASGGS
mmetsp:Transcript_2625/g.6590  ORF Transcript_2625/g.6590 Transcript_2625/m.6590 type:complete len:241 (-) Transcript_2625:100-822(-)